MGEMADDLVDGTTCSWCGAFFVDENGNIYTHGYPVVCKQCFHTATKKEQHQARKDGLQVATKDTL